MTVMDLTALLEAMVREKASDLFITAGLPPSMKINGRIRPVARQAFDGKQVAALMQSMMTPTQQDQFAKTYEAQFAFTRKGIGRFRVSGFYQRGNPGMVVRHIESRIPTVNELGLPLFLNDLAMSDRGLVILTGATGSGKSTTLAAMLGYRNHHANGHIITIEDPIEFVYSHAGCIVTQRELGLDTTSWEAALGNVLRQSPDMVVIGEIRTRSTMEYALRLARSGHFCVCTLHASNADQAIDRVLNFFDASDRERVLTDLSLNLKAIIAQRLVPAIDKKRRVMALEVLTNTPAAQEYLRAGDVEKLIQLMQRSGKAGMCTFDQSVVRLFKEGKISYDHAIRYADSANEVRLAIKLARGDEDATADGQLKRMEIELPEDDNEGINLG